MAVEDVIDPKVPAELLLEYQREVFAAQGALPAPEVDRLIEESHQKLLAAAASSGSTAPSESGGIDFLDPAGSARPRVGSTANPWNRVSRKPGPKTDIENYSKVARIMSAYGPQWTTDDNLLAEICEELDSQKVPTPKRWTDRTEGTARSWNRGRLLYPQLVIRAIKDRLEALEKEAPNGAGTSPNFHEAPKTSPD
jgi:hypothetical protein